MATKEPRKSAAKAAAGKGSARKTHGKRPATGTVWKRIADVIRLIPDAAMVIDTDGKVRGWNRAMEGLTGVKAGAVLGKGNYEYSLPFYGERRPVLADLALKEAGGMKKKYQSITPWGNTLVAEAKVTNLPGGPATVYGSATVLKNSRGRVLGVLELVCEVRK